MALRLVALDGTAVLVEIHGTEAQPGQGDNAYLR